MPRSWSVFAIANLLIFLFFFRNMPRSWSVFAIANLLIFHFFSDIWKGTFFNAVLDNYRQQQFIDKGYRENIN